jgi:hypothetical protein
VPTFVDRGVSRGQRGGSPTPVNPSFLDRIITIIIIIIIINFLAAGGLLPGVSGTSLRHNT